jgi:hypothetical protein
MYASLNLGMSFPSCTYMSFFSGLISYTQEKVNILKIKLAQHNLVLENNKETKLAQHN